MVVGSSGLLGSESHFVPLEADISPRVCFKGGGVMDNRLVLPVEGSPKEVYDHEDNDEDSDTDEFESSVFHWTDRIPNHFW